MTDRATSTPPLLTEEELVILSDYQENYESPLAQKGEAGFHWEKSDYQPVQSSQDLASPANITSPPVEIEEDRSEKEANLPIQLTQKRTTEEIELFESEPVAPEKVAKSSHSLFKTKYKITDTCLPNDNLQKIPAIALHQVSYKAASPVIRNPLIPYRHNSCSKYGKRKKSHLISAERYPCWQKNLSLERNDLAYYREICHNEWSPNPTGSNLVRLLKLSKSLRSTSKKTNTDWLEVEENLKNKRDHDLAVELGYETLVGNILYIDIPSGRDINRSWQNYLSQDPMEWGFPYHKGTTVRPRMKQLEPYLAHQMVEKLWKFPKAARRRGNSVDDMSVT